MFFDYHMHSNFSKDSKAPMEDMIKRSIELGIKEICFTDHMEHNAKGDSTWVVNYNDYFNEYNLLKEKYQKYISIKIGIEMGLQSHLIERCRKDILENPFDFVICSQHSIDEIDFSKKDFFNSRTQKDAYAKYFVELLNILNNFNDYSVVGHLDLIKRYGHYKNILDDNLFNEVIEEILKVVINSGRGIELNTSCYRYNLPDLTPSRHILKMYKDLGGEIITTGSDSHSTDQIGYKFEYIYSHLKELGFNYVCSYDKMKPIFNKI
ncbi:MAG: histidinol-phosphatase HisJ family protein [Peptostreptococcaceae bacterium]